MGENEPGYRLTAESYVEKLKGKSNSKNGGDDGKNSTNLLKADESSATLSKTSAVAVIPGKDYADSFPHAPWPSRSMLKRRVVLGGTDIKVRNGVTKIVYPRGAIYEGEVQDRKRHGNGVYRWPQGDKYEGMWWMGLMHGLGVAEYASGAAYCGEWYLGERVGHGMYFYAPSTDEPHKEYAGQWANDMLHGIGKRLSKDGTVYAGQWKNGLRHGDGICRVARDTILDPVGGVANVIRRIGGAGATGRFTQVEAKDRQEIDLERVMGGIADWHAETLGVIVQEGRFVLDFYDPRDKHEIAARARRAGAGAGAGDGEEEEDPEEDERQRERRRRRQARKRAMQRKHGAVLSSKDFPPDPVHIEDIRPAVQTAMEISDASELVAQKVRSKYLNANFNFRVAKHE